MSLVIAPIKYLAVQNEFAHTHKKKPHHEADSHKCE